MNFQFYCPQGHLLQSDTANAGCTIACPICGTQFIVPAPPQSILDAEKAQKEPEEEPEEETESLFAFGSGKKRRSGGTNLNDFLATQEEDDEDDEDEDEDEAEDEDEDEEDSEDSEGAEPLLAFDPTANDRGSDLPPLHIPCPNGHVLEVPREMLGEDAECPDCGEIFTLRRDKSFEFLNERYQRESRAEAKASQEWFVRAMIGVGLAIGLLLLLFLS